MKKNNGWNNVPLDEVAKIYNGNSINKDVKTKKYANIVTGRNYIGTKDINFDGSVVYENGIKIPFEETNFKVAPAGSVFVCAEGGSAGKKTAYVNEEVCFGNKLFAIVCNNDIVLGKYLYYYTRSNLFYKQFSSEKTGIIGGVSSKKFGQIKLPVPPISEQERIVARIEELFSQLDKSVETLQKVKEQLAVYRQAVLKDAFAECKTWDKVTFGDLMLEVHNGYGKKPDDEGNNKILRISSVRAMNVDFSDYRLNKTTFSENDIIHENDLLFTRYNGSVDYVGVCAFVPKHNEVFAYPDKIIKCTPKYQNTIHSKYLQYYMNCGEARKYIRSKIKTTSGQNGIAGSDIKKTTVYIPDIIEQEKIVTYIESRMSSLESIEKTISDLLQQAEAMRQSVLKQAFEGKL